MGFFDKKDITCYPYNGVQQCEHCGSIENVRKIIVAISPYVNSDLNRCDNCINAYKAKIEHELDLLSQVEK